MSENKTVPMSVRLSPELNTRLEECAKRLRQKKHSLAQEAIEAAVIAIEKNGFKLVIPIEFEVSHVPVAAPKNSSSSNSAQEETSGGEQKQGTGAVGGAKKTKAA